jgi:hypothetical protein
VLGIDLGGDGQTLNHPGGVPGGPNNLQNYPVLSRVEVDANGDVVFEGTVNSTPGARVTLEFFASPFCHAGSFSASGEGLLFLGTATVTVNEGSGNASFAILMKPVPVSQAMTSAMAGQVVTATATDDKGNTSEFSDCITAAAGSVRPRRQSTINIRPRG